MVRLAQQLSSCGQNTTFFQITCSVNERTSVLLAHDMCSQISIGIHIILCKQADQYDIHDLIQ